MASDKRVYRTEYTTDSMHILAIDIETGGCMVGVHPIIAIGTCLMTPQGYETKRFTFDFLIGDLEERCWDEFWSKNLETLETFIRDKKTTIKEFADYVDELDREFPNLIILSDNPSFDIGFINYHYAKDLHRKPLQYKATGPYRVITDTDSFYYALTPSTSGNWVWSSDIARKFGIGITNPTSHFPEEDATYIANLFVQIMAKLINRQ